MKYLIVCAALFAAGCDVPQDAETNISTVNYTVRTIKVKGHEYIMFDGFNKGNIIHSESCPCKKETESCK